MSTQDEAQVIDLGDLKPIEVHYRIGGKGYLLREAGEEAVCRWRNFNFSCRRYRDGNLIGLEGSADSEPLLVSLCLFSANDAGEYKVPVPLSVVKGWPARVVGPLFDKAQQISGLVDKDTIQSLTERIRRDTDRLEELRREKAAEDAQGPNTEVDASKK